MTVSVDNSILDGFRINQICVFRFMTVNVYVSHRASLILFYST